MASIHREAIQKQIEQDWANREYIELITRSIKRITDFLNSFGSYNFTLVLFVIFNALINCKLIFELSGNTLIILSRYVMQIEISRIK